MSDAPGTPDDQPGLSGHTERVPPPPVTGAGPELPPSTRPQKKSRLPQSKWGRVATEWGIVIVGALVVVVVIRAFLFQAYYIPSPSMYPTLHDGDRVMVNKLSYKVHGVHRGDIVVFNRPNCKGKELPSWATCNEGNEIKDLIKRVIGLPGDTIELRSGTVYVNGRALKESYVFKDANGHAVQSLPICAFPGSYKVPDGDVFVMGDNRTNSTDSRCFGPIHKSTIVGRAFIRVWPLGRIGFL